MKKNTKIIVWSIVGLAVATGAFFGIRALIRKDGSNKSKQSMATQKEAIETLEILNKKDTPLNPTQTKRFVDNYTSAIDLNTHAKIKSLLSKKESEWTSEDKLTFVVFSEKVLKPTSAVNPKKI